MLHVSDKWKEYTEDNHNFLIKGVLTLTDGTSLNLTGDDFMNACINDAVSEMDSITIGAVVTNRFSGSLNNMEDRFTGLDLEGASLSVQAGLIYEDETEEWLDKGTYTLDQPSVMGAVLQITGYDSMDTMNRYYVGTHPVDGIQHTITFPIDSKTLASYLCDYCGVSYDQDFWQIANNLQISKFEYNESTTCRQVLNWILQINCGYARISNQNKLVVKWYGDSLWGEVSDELEGGTIQPWAGEDTADGGVMDPWAVVADIDGGIMSISINEVSSIDMATRSVNITGIKAFAYGTVDEFIYSMAGHAGYVMALKDNPLITKTNTSTVANAVNDVISNMGFRPYSAKIEANPCLEAGDGIAIMDYKGNYHFSFISNLAFNWGAATSISCNAESTSQTELEFSNPQTSAVQTAAAVAFDYLTAQKISADYISAGTINAAVVATDFSLTGGTIHIETDENKPDWITLKQTTGTGELEATLSPTRVGVAYDVDYYADFLCGGTSNALVEVGYWSGQTNTQVLYADATGKIIIDGTGSFTLVGTARATSFVNTSRLDVKKNLKQIDSVLDKIKSADILSFNFKDEGEKAKAHLGLAIGEDYNTPEEVIAVDEDGVEQGIDLYSMVSMAWKAIQEQQTIIEELEKRIEVLEKKLNPFGNIKDIIKGDNDGNTN